MVVYRSLVRGWVVECDRCLQTWTTDTRTEADAIVADHSGWHDRSMTTTR